MPGAVRHEGSDPGGGQIREENDQPTQGVMTSRAYNTWKNMRQRCSNSNRPDYKYYGGRGIRVCARWDSFAAFLIDMGEPPAGYSLDRRNNERGYSPKNCRWALRSTQMRNTRRRISIDGVDLKAVALETGVRYTTLYMRLRRDSKHMRRRKPIQGA